MLFSTFTSAILTWLGLVAATVNAQDGYVTSIYSYASPAVTTSSQGLRNGKAPDNGGKFDGIRVYSAKNYCVTFFGWTVACWDITDPLAAWYDTWGFYHPRVARLVLQFDSSDNFSGCSLYDADNPGSDSGVGLPDFDWTSPITWREGHSIPIYDKGRRGCTQYNGDLPDADAAGRISINMNEATETNWNSASWPSGWNLIHFEEVDGGTYRDKDSIALFQHPSDNRCILAFEGSDSNSWGLELLSQVIPTSNNDFCGSSDLIDIQTTEMANILNSSKWDTVKDDLPGCSSVSTTGASLGAAMATVFAYCANAADDTVEWSVGGGGSGYKLSPKAQPTTTTTTTTARHRRCGTRWCNKWWRRAYCSWRYGC